MDHLTDDSTLIQELRRNKIGLQTPTYYKLPTKTTSYSLSQNQPKKSTFGNTWEILTHQTPKYIKI